MSKKRSGQIAQLLDYNFTIRTGIESENRVEEALRTMAQTGEIHSYYRSMRDQELDGMGIDFIVWLENDCNPMLLQIKSSLRGKEEHEAHYGRRIACIVVKQGESTAELIVNIRKAFSIDTTSIQEAYDQALQNLRNESI